MTIDKKQETHHNTVLQSFARKRLIVVFLVLILVAIGYFSTVGIGNLCALGWKDLYLICPLGALGAMIAQKTIIPQALISLAIAAVGLIVLGKVFCSWVCPVPFLQKAMPGKGKKAAEIAGETVHTCASCSTPCNKKKGVHLDSRHGVLAGALVSTLIFGFPVFCLICPVGLSLASVLLIMRLFAFGEVTWAVIIVPLIIIAEIVFLPRWCQKICPLGALMSIMSIPNKTFVPVIDADKCLKHAKNVECNLCVTVCAEGINLHDIDAGQTTLNDCTKCRECAHICPSKAISFPLLPKKASSTEATIEAMVDSTKEQ